MTKVLKKVRLSKEERLLKGALLKFDENHKPKDLAELINNYFTKDFYNPQNNVLTYTASTGRKSGNYNSRSIEDLFRLCRYYISTINYMDIEDIVKSTLFSILTGWHCSTCGRHVYKFKTNIGEITKIRELLKDKNIEIK